MSQKMLQLSDLVDFSRCKGQLTPEPWCLSWVPERYVSTETHLPCSEPRVTALIHSNTTL